MRPKTLKVVGKSYSVTYTKGEPLAEDLSGECDPASQSILIRNDQPLETEQDTLLHEGIHALDDAMQLGLREQQVRKLATGLLALFKNNPGFVRYLAKKK